jgi:hypothetical protein
MAQAQTQVQYPVRAVAVSERVYFTLLKLQKPQYAPFVAAIQATMNQHIVPYSFLAMGYAAGFVDNQLITQYTNLVQPKINEVVGVFGVEFSVQAEGIRGGLKLRLKAKKGDKEAGHEADLVGAGPDFGPLYAESKDLAKARWDAFTKMLKEQDVPSILHAAALGYEWFMLGGNPTPKQQIAVVKHKMRLAAVDPAEYVKRVREAVERYAAGYTYGISKYSYVIKWVSEGLRAAFHATRIVLEVL